MHTACMGSSHDTERVSLEPRSDTRGAEQLRRARALMGEGRLDHALASCEALLQSAPDWPGGLELLGDIQVRLEMWARGARSYVTALAREPDNASLFVKLGDLQRRCWDEVGASQSYRRASELERSQRAPDEETRTPLEGSPSAAAAYLDLMKGCLTFLLWEASDGSLLELNARHPIVSLARAVQKVARRRNPPAPSLRELGMDWPARALTMVGKRRLDNVQHCVERVLADQIPGDLLEAGAWRGGVTIFMRAILRAYGDTERRVWVADSFRGLPRPNTARYPADRGYELSSWRSLAVSLEEVRDNFRRFQLLDEQVVFLEGWFADTLPVAPIERLAVLRLDGDLYESTMDCLVHLYSKVSRGGFLIADDYYGAPPCKQAVDDFRQRNKIREEMTRIDGYGAFWRKE